MNVLNHIAFIMDGNRRWAVERGKPRVYGHKMGVETLKQMIKACIDLELKAATFWALSTENLKNRSEGELKHIFALLNQLPTFMEEFEESGIRFYVIGDVTQLPEKTQFILKEIEEKTRNNKGLMVTVALNYGGRDELMRVYKKLLQQQITAREITEELIDSMLDTAPLPEVDMIIRTGGGKRLSGFLSWQSVYSEYYFTDIKWPAFSKEELEKAVEWFKGQSRNKGK